MKVILNFIGIKVCIPINSNNGLHKSKEFTIFDLIFDKCVLSQICLTGQPDTVIFFFFFPMNRLGIGSS